MFLSKVGRIYYIWYFDEDTGKRNKLSTRCKTKTDALKSLHDLRGKFAYRKKAGISIATYSQQYLDYSRVNHAHSHSKRIEYVLSPFQKFIKWEHISQITPLDIEAYKTYRLTYLSPVTVNIELRILKAFFNRAVKWELIEKSPFRNVKLLRIPEKKPCFLTTADFYKLLGKMPMQWLRSVVIFAVNTGMRRSEVVNLQWDHIDWTRDMVTVTNTDSFTTKSGRQRVIPLNSTAKNILKEQGRASKYVFVNAKGRQMKGNYLCQCFRQCVDDAGLDERLNFHSLRHTFASWLVQNSVPLYEVQKLLGHSSMAVTQIYSHLQPETLHSSVNKISLNLN